MIPEPADVHMHDLPTEDLIRMIEQTRAGRMGVGRVEGLRAEDAYSMKGIETEVVLAALEQELVRRKQQFS